MEAKKFEDGKPSFTFKCFDEYAMLLARMAIAKAMEAETIAFQGHVVSLPRAEYIKRKVQEKTGW